LNTSTPPRSPLFLSASHILFKCCNASRQPFWDVLQCGWSLFLSLRRRSPFLICFLFLVISFVQIDLAQRACGRPLNQPPRNAIGMEDMAAGQFPNAHAIFEFIQADGTFVKLTVVRTVRIRVRVMRIADAHLLVRQPPSSRPRRWLRFVQESRSDEQQQATAGACAETCRKQHPQEDRPPGC